MMYENSQGGKETPGLEDYLNAIRQRKLVIVVCGLLGLFLSILLTSTRTATFSADARVLVNPTAVGFTRTRASALKVAVRVDVSKIDRNRPSRPQTTMTSFRCRMAFR